MEFLKHIDFDNHDGVHLPMINDVLRNQFYDRVLEQVQDQYCIEIGFGTGLLSMLAIKHGACHVTAYESDPARFQLGCAIIQLLKVENKITLLNQRFDYNRIGKGLTIFTETVDENIWGEGLFNSLPRTNGQNFLPGQYFLEIHAVPLTVDMAQHLTQTWEEKHFAPGVDINPKFVSCINLLLAKKYRKSLKPKISLSAGVTELNTDKNLIRFVSDNTCVAGYTVDANAPFVDTSVYKVEINTQDQPVLIIPRAGLRHRNRVLYLDTGHWGVCKNPVIVNQPHSQVTVSQDLHTGKISYTIKE
jgi:hypothetical protein